MSAYEGKDCPCLATVFPLQYLVTMPFDMGLTPGYGSPPGPKYTSTRAGKGTPLASTNQTDKMQRQPHQEPERLLSSTIKVAITTT